MSTTQLSATQQIIAQHDQHMALTYARYPIVMARGKGCELWDAEGKRYLDLFAGFGGPILGHCHEELIEALHHQANQLWHVGNLFHTEPQTRLAEAIARLGFAGKSFFCHGGADANEAAIKLARLHGRAHPGPEGPRYKVITALQSFHGRTLGTIAATGQEKVREGFAPHISGFVHVPFGELAAMRAAVDEQTAAIMVEPIQGEGGMNVPGDDYLPGLRQLCDEKNLLLICDEVWTGCGRTGRYFAHQHWGITPDIMTLAKGVGGGMGVGVMCSKAEVAELLDWKKYGRAVHGTTLGGNCLAMAVAARVFHIIERDGLTERAQQLGQHAMDMLKAFAQTCPLIKAVRGKGLFIGIELDPTGTGAWFKNAGEVVKKCLAEGLLLNNAQEQVLRIAPALNIGEDVFDQGLKQLMGVLRGN